MKKEPECSVAKKQKKKCRPPFDFFGISPHFYINGSDKTVSYVGFACSLILICTLTLLSTIYAINFIKNKNSVVYSSLKTAKDAPVIDLAEKKFILAYRISYP